MLQPRTILRSRYQLLEQLGRTAVGRQTWLAENLQSQERVIVKLLTLNPRLQWDNIKLFEREAQVLQHLHHTCIPQYRDYFALDERADLGLPWFVLVQSYVQGDSLQYLLDRGQRFTLEQIKSIATQVMNILVYLHELSPPVLHRDIKPSNLIYGENERVYLVDFGSVQDRAKAEGASFTVVGTSGYVPPEQLWGKAVPASDLYALGATLIHLLTGVAPGDLSQQNFRIQFRDRVNLPEPFACWLDRLIAPAVEQRFPSAREALKALSLLHFLSDVSQKSLKSRDPLQYRLTTTLILFAFVFSFPVFYALEYLSPHRVASRFTGIAIARNVKVWQYSSFGGFNFKIIFQFTDKQAADFLNAIKPMDSDIGNYFESGAGGYYDSSQLLQELETVGSCMNGFIHELGLAKIGLDIKKTNSNSFYAGGHICCGAIDQSIYIFDLTNNKLYIYGENILTRL
jgi:serine/threonine protein kinase